MRYDLDEFMQFMTNLDELSSTISGEVLKLEKPTPKLREASSELKSILYGFLVAALDYPE